MLRFAREIFLLGAVLGLSACASSVVLRAPRIYVAPDRPPIVDGVLVIRRGEIVAVGPRDRVALPPRAEASQCSGVVTAGFQNSHVHFIEPRFQDAGRQPAPALEHALDAIATRWGFTTVFDVASDLANTLTLRRRVERGEVRGPRILTAGAALFPPNGLPHYLRDLPPEFLAAMHQPRDATAARRAVRENLGGGADATKLFLVTSPDRRATTRLASDVARAAADETRARGKLTLAHPSTLAGMRAALDAGIDVVVHTTLGEPPWDSRLVEELVARRVAVIPTLALWRYELQKDLVPEHTVDRLVATALRDLGSFASSGGQILFGTDVGYMHDDDPTVEYTSMAQAGLSPMQILASLTTAPAARWGEARGRIVPAAPADLVVLAGDPAEDVRNFARVRCVYRDGRLIYDARGPRR